MPSSASPGVYFILSVTSTNGLQWFLENKDIWGTILEEHSELSGTIGPNLLLYQILMVLVLEFYKPAGKAIQPSLTEVIRDNIILRVG